jgi:hypothetical protein
MQPGPRHDPSSLAAARGARLPDVRARSYDQQHRRVDALEDDLSDGAATTITCRSLSPTCSLLSVVTEWTAAGSHVPRCAPCGPVINGTGRVSNMEDQFQGTFEVFEQCCWKFCFALRPTQAAVGLECVKAVGQHFVRCLHGSRSDVLKDRNPPRRNPEPAGIAGHADFGRCAGPRRHLYRSRLAFQTEKMGLSVITGGIHAHAVQSRMHAPSGPQSSRRPPPTHPPSAKHPQSLA